MKTKSILLLSAALTAILAFPVGARTVSAYGVPGRI